MKRIFDFFKHVHVLLFLLGSTIFAVGQTNHSSTPNTDFTPTNSAEKAQLSVSIPFPNFSVYPNGTVSTVYNAGPGLASDAASTTTEDSKMVVISSTNEATFTAYIQTLLDNGFTKVSERRVDKNLFYTLKNDNKLYYLYLNASNQVRILQDNSTRTMLTDLDAAVQGTGTTEFYLYSLDYTHGEGQTSTSDYWKIDCGALILIKLKDNSLYIIDSGHQRQSSNAAMEGLMNFMYKITGQEQGSTLNIRSWFISHAHGDHVYFIYPFLGKYHNVLNLESIMYNIPSYQTMSGGYDAGTFLMKQAFNTYYPKCKYVKLHTGQTFTLQGVAFDVMHTHEDGVTSDGVTSMGDFNDTSTILRLLMDGKRFMLLGDAGSVSQTNMVAMYAPATLLSDCVQTSHHGYNNLTSLYAAIKAPLALFNNSRQNVGSNSAAYLGVVNAATAVKVLFCDPYTYKLTVASGLIKTESMPSYRSTFTTLKVPALSVGIIATSGIKLPLNAVLAKTSLYDQLIDKSVTGTVAKVTETCSLMLDGLTSTKFCTDTIPATIVWTMKKPVVLKWYVIYSANDNATRPGRNPQKWVICGSNDGKNWTSVDSVANAQLPDANFTGTAFAVSRPGLYKYYALKMFSTVSAPVLQISELGLYGDADNTSDLVAPRTSNQLPIRIKTKANHQISVAYLAGLASDTSVTVYNAVGKMLFSQPLKGTEMDLTMPGSGLYIVSVSDSKSKTVRKVLLD